MKTPFAVPPKYLSTWSDEEIIQGIQRSDITETQGIEALITRHIPTLCHYLSRLRNYDEALIKDVVAETALILWEQFDRYDPDQAEFLTWAKGIARNKLREASRQGIKQPTLSLDAISEPTAGHLYQYLAANDDPLVSKTDYKTLEKKVLALVMSLSELDRTLFLLKGNYDLTFEELADLVNQVRPERPITANALAKRFYRTRERLKALFQSE